MSWIRGTVKDVKAWIRKETEGMLPPSEVYEEVFKDVEDNHLSHLVVKKDKPEELKDQEGTWFDSPVANTSHTAAKEEKNMGNTNWKPTNPKDLMGIRKVSFCCVPFTVLGEMALGMQEGGMKYGRHNYRDEGVATSTYIDAVFRHITDYWEGEDIDPESGVHHLSKAMSTLCVLRDAQLNDKCTDDRPIRPTNPNWLKDLNAKASKLVDKYPQPETPYTHKPLPRRK